MKRRSAPKANRERSHVQPGALPIIHAGRKGRHVTRLNPSKGGGNAAHSRANNEKPAPRPDRFPLGLITAQQLARELECSARTVRRRIQAGDLPRPFKIGGITCWRRSVLKAWLRKREEEARCG